MDGLLFLRTLAAVAAPLAHNNIAAAPQLILERRTAIAGAVVAVAASTTATRAAAEIERCAADRCSSATLIASSHVPARIREALRVAIGLCDDWNKLTSDCTGNLCKVSSRIVIADYLSESSTLMALATDGTLRQPITLSLIESTDKQAYLRNALRFESGMRFAASSASLSQFDPPLPSFAKGSYVPKGLKDENGNLLGSNLENAREFLLDATDALIVVCSFIYYTRPAAGGDYTRLRGGATLASLPSHRAPLASRNPLLVRIDGSWYNLTDWQDDHPGGSAVLRRAAHGESTHLFYSNHRDPRIAALKRFQLPEGVHEPLTVAAPTSEPHSALYRELKAEVYAHLEARGIDWRHTFRWEPYALRLACLVIAHTLLVHGDPATSSSLYTAIIGFGCAAAYGFLTGRMTWTHAHNAVHNPQALPPAMALLMRFDFVGVVEAWMAEHHAHHAHTNSPDDPDVRWFAPLFDYSQLAAPEAGGSAQTAALACLAYPFLVPFMLVKSLKHAWSNDPDGQYTLAWVLAIAPLRFAADIFILGPEGFAVALLVATTYICGTFVATHQTQHNYQRSGDWAIDQMHSTNDVLPESEFWSKVTGGISHHTEHHLFPHISSDALPEVSKVVSAFAAKHNLPRHAYSPTGLLKEHAALLSGEATESKCPVARVKAALGG